MASFQKSSTVLFISGKKRKLDHVIDSDTTAPKKTKKTPHQVSIVTPDSDAFIDALCTCSCGIKPAILYLVPKYMYMYLASYVSKNLLDAFPQSLPMLHEPAKWNYNTIGYCRHWSAKPNGVESSICVCSEVCPVL